MNDVTGFGRFRIWLQIWVTIAYKVLLEVNTKDLLNKIAPKLYMY